MPRGHHDKDSKYWHIRLPGRAGNPDNLKNMKTVDRGPIKQVSGIDKKTKKWVDQNIMVKKKDAKVSGSRLIITNKKVRESFQDRKLLLSRIFRRKDGGEADYAVKKQKKKKIIM